MHVDVLFVKQTPSVAAFPCGVGGGARRLLSFLLRQQLKRSLTTIMSTSTSSSSSSSSSSAAPTPALYRVPDLRPDEMASAADTAFNNSKKKKKTPWKRSGDGVAIMWFRNDLRVLDNEALIRAWESSASLVAVYCIDPRLLSPNASTHYFSFPKTGALRAKFLIECLTDLKRNLMKMGLDLLVRNGKPEDVIPSISKAFGAHSVFAQKETCSEEVQVEQFVRKGLQQISLIPKLHLVWGLTMYHIDDLPFTPHTIPDVYTHFRKSVESKCSVRGCFDLPESLGPAPSSTQMEQIGGWGTIPSLEDLGLQLRKAEHYQGMHFIGGESAALGRVHEYFWKKDLLRVYKETRNGMLGPNYSTKFSPWLASGSLSPRYVYEEVSFNYNWYLYLYTEFKIIHKVIYALFSFIRQRDTRRRELQMIQHTGSLLCVGIVLFISATTNSLLFMLMAHSRVLFELIWRDYFRFISLKYGNTMFQIGGPRKVESKWSQDKSLFESWRDGQTGYPLIDANMRELSTTGFMSNRGRQIVCSFLVRDMGIDWRMGAEWFETCLLDYDPCSNYGNWTYGAGVGNDPREDRYFSIPKQAKTYDPEGDYVSYWLPQLKFLPKEKRNFPGSSYIKRVVELKFDNSNQRHDQISKGTRGRGRGRGRGKFLN